MDHFKLVSEYRPTGDQPQAIAELTAGVEAGYREQALMGVTGSGKTFTMANIIANVNRPTLVLAHNKTLAAQLCSEFREFFPENAVEYFVSLLRLLSAGGVYCRRRIRISRKIPPSTTKSTSCGIRRRLALSERRDVIIVASVSCIYSLGDPIDYRSMVISLRPGMQKSRDELLQKLVELQYNRNDINFNAQPLPRSRRHGRDFSGGGQ